MSVATGHPLTSASAQPTVRSRQWRPDLVTGVLALGLALWVTSALWADPAGRVSQVNASDQALFEWLLSFGAYAVTHGMDPMFTHLLNVPDGVNLAVNTSITVYAVLLAPVTLWLGPTVSFLAILTLNLAGSAFAWYWLFSRHLGAKPVGAAVGGLFCGFAPAMISHANAHLNWTAQWLVPLIIIRFLLLVRRQRPVRDGVIMGVLIAACFSIAAEQLFFAALALMVFTAAWVWARRAEARQLAPQFFKGIGVAAAVSFIFLAYPLYLHFAGPQGYHGTGFSQRVHSEDLAAYAVWPKQSLAGALGLNTDLAANATEENSFFGAPLLALTVIGFVLLWRRLDVRALALTAGVFAVLSLGPELHVMHFSTGVPMPDVLVGWLPVFNAALPSRLALVVAPIVGLLLAWVLSAPLVGPRQVWLLAFGVALLPLVPTPLLARDRAPVPHFITSGAWKSYVADGGVLTPVPLPNDLLPDGQRWQAAVLADAIGNDGEIFRLPSGFFLGPGGPNGTGRIGPVPRPTAALLEGVAKTGQVPPISAQQKAQALLDLRYWNTHTVVLADNVAGAHWTAHQPQLLETMTRLLGPPQRVDDVWLWQIP